MSETKSKYSIARTFRRALSTFAATFALNAMVSAGSINVERIVQEVGADIEHSTIVVIRQSDDWRWISNLQRADTRFSPASTSKIPHTLIALESGLATPATQYTWDGVFRSVRSWNKDQTLASAFRSSVVWVYQEIALSAGQTAMSEGLAQFGYGNESIGTIDQLTTYWLDDTLKISAVEQVAFLSKLATKQLPLSEGTYAFAMQIMESDRGTNWVMRSKTGWRHSNASMDVGWHVGWLECFDEIYVFATNLDMPDTSYLSKRVEISHSVLKEIGAFDCER